MSAPVIVDSSWYIGESSLGRDPLLQLSYIAESRDLAVCGLIMVEVGRGIRDKRFLDRYRQVWSQMLYVSSERNLWEKTLELAWKLDRTGVVLPLQDVHIAVCAFEIGGVVLTHDRHFNKIPGIVATGQVV